MLKFKNWENQYISLARTIPQFLISEEDGLSAAQLQTLMVRLGGSSCIAVDLGCGSGGHLIELAKANPAILYLGVELRFKRAFRAAKKAQQLELSNVLIYRGTIQNFMQASAATCFDHIYVNFPDPWSKRRWLKHRLLTTEFLELIAQRLSAKGIFHYKTDHAQYFEQTLEQLNSLGKFRISSISRDLHAESQNLLNTETEFEKLFKQQGLPICALEAMRSW